MNRDVLKDINLLKKHHHNTVFDYTEYPTKANWSFEMKDGAYRAALKDWLTASPGKPALFYLHTPFCEELCYFCLCSKEITKDYSQVKNYLDNFLFKEIDLLVDLFKTTGLKPSFREVYMGGGSPTYYREPEFEALMNKLRTFIDFSKLKTFTVEIDPRRVDVDRLRFYHKFGVNRLSFGVQDFDPEVQEEINRHQPPELLYKLMTPEIRKLFPIINFDILIGLPKQTPKTMAKTIQTVVDLGPEQVQTLYVHYKPTVRKYMIKMVRNVPMPDFYDRKAIFVEVVDQLLKGGYKRVGFEDFAKPDSHLAASADESKAYYNSLGTTSGDAPNFIAVGSSAHGVFGKYYFQNFYEQNLYREALDRGEFPIYRGYKLTDEDELRRDLIKRIRTYFSIDFASVEKQYKIDFRKHFAKELKTLEEFAADGIVSIQKGRFDLTELGKHFSPQVASVFDAYLTRPAFNKDIFVGEKAEQPTKTKAA